ncbi:alpha/beta fold hydrolase [Streptomyces sp. NPDC059063]|uniref:alpha/beta hydrolase n=1 Tax=unclassified Streptomyces TaxID=2593676 RepID=UPI0036C1D75E
MHASDRPTIVLVHGAFTDASCWGAVIGHLHRAGLTVRAPANALRGPAADAERLLRDLARIDGPVMLVGHGYGGAVVTRAGGRAANVVGLGYVAAFAPDQAESIADIVTRFRPAPGADALTRAPGSPDSGGSALTVTADRFADVLAADLAAEHAAVRAVSQRPLTAGALRERSSDRPAWALLRSWYALAVADRIIPPPAQRFMAQRMAATEYPMDASHLLPLSRAEALAQVIGAEAERAALMT